MTVERWAFSESELADLEGLTRHDELIASVTEGERGVIVYRNGEVSARLEDGTFGVIDELRDSADATDTLYHPAAGEFTERWANVEVDAEGRFVRFVASRFQGPEFA